MSERPTASELLTGLPYEGRAMRLTRGAAARGQAMVPVAVAKQAVRGRVVKDGSGRLTLRKS